MSTRKKEIRQPPPRLKGDGTGRRIRDIDIKIGARIRAARSSKNITQDVLAYNIGLTFQQLGKYENGINRVSASKLLDIANVLDMPIEYFYDGVA